MKSYLDNSATTMPSKFVKEKINEFLNTTYGNPSSLHDLGIISERKIKRGKKIIATDLKCSVDEIIFTSGGTESNNLSIIGFALANKGRGKHLITTAYEHKSVLNSFKYLESLGYQVTYLTVGNAGEIDEKQLKEALTNETILVSIMHINNEIGRINPINDFGKIIKDYNSKIAFHVDGVQSFGKFNIDLRAIDLYTFSGHKIHALKGIGGMYIKKNLKLQPIHFGGQQEKGVRPGTENLLGIVSLDAALRESIQKRKESLRHVEALKYYVSNFILEKIEEARINVTKDRSSPYILSVSFKDVMSEVLLHDLESKGVYISTGSACDSKNNTNSHVLESINLGKDFIGGSIRLSFSRENSLEEVKFACEALKESIENIRQVIQRR